MECKQCGMAVAILFLRPFATNRNKFAHRLSRSKFFSSLLNLRTFLGNYWLTNFNLMQMFEIIDGLCIVPEGITEIESDSFRGRTDLTRVIIP